MTSKEQLDFQMRMMAAQNQANAALKEGLGVDFGGVIVGPPQPLGTMPTDPFTSDDGNRRQGKK